MKLKHILILQNKIDLVKESQAKEQYEQILAFVKGELIHHYLHGTNCIRLRTQYRSLSEMSVRPVARCRGVG